MCHHVIRTIGNSQLALKPLQKIRGYLNYYLSFAGNFHSVINRYLLESQRLKYLHVIKWLVKEDFISFYKPALKETITYWSDATLTQVAFTDCITVAMARRQLASSIQINELNAYMWSLKYFARNAKKDHLKFKHFKLLIFADNLNVLFYLRSGRCKWQGMHFNHHFKNLRLIEYLKTHHGLTIGYVASKDNPADRLSRMPLDYLERAKAQESLGLYPRATLTSGLNLDEPNKLKPETSTLTSP